MTPAAGNPQEATVVDLKSNLLDFQAAEEQKGGIRLARNQAG